MSYLIITGVQLSASIETGEDAIFCPGTDALVPE